MADTVFLGMDPATSVISTGNSSATNLAAGNSYTFTGNWDTDCTASFSGYSVSN